jgi:23S rRNA A2030 N6-methylase RlmJ
MQVFAPFLTETNKFSHKSLDFYIGSPNIMEKNNRQPPFTNHLELRCSGVQFILRKSLAMITGTLDAQRERERL